MVLVFHVGKNIEDAVNEANVLFKFVMVDSHMFTLLSNL